MAVDLSHVTVAILATDGVEQIELTQPRDALVEAGATVHLVAPKDEIQGYDHLDAADTFTADRRVHDVNPGTYDALVLPGGVANPDALRTDQDAVDFVCGFLDAGKTVAAICHAPWTLVEADAVRGRRMTSWPSLQTDLRNAGAEWVDEEVVEDRSGNGLLITSRNPDDLPAFSRTLVEDLAKLEHLASGVGPADRA